MVISQRQFPLESIIDEREKPIESLLDNGTIITRSHIDKLHRMGYHTILDVAKITEPVHLARAVGMGFRDIVHIIHVCQVRGRFVVKRKNFRLPNEPPLWLDIETDTSWRKIWLIGVLDAKTGEMKQFLANDWNEESKILEELDEYLCLRSSQPLIYYAFNGFDVRRTIDAARRHGFRDHRIYSHPHLDLYRPLKDAYWVPTKKPNGRDDRRLKTLAAFTGFDMSLEDRPDYMDGRECAIHYEKHVEYGVPLDKNVLVYNANDVYMLPFVVSRLEELSVY